MLEKLKVKNIIELASELNLFLEEEFNHAKKYHIEMFLQSLTLYTDPAEKMRQNLISKYGDGISISPILEDGNPNPSIKNFWQEYNEVLNQEVEIEFNKNIIDLELLNNIKSKNRYKLISFYLIK